MSVILFGGLAYVLTPETIQAKTAKDQFERGLKDTGEKAGYPSGGGDTTSFGGRLGVAIKLVLSFLGVIFLGLTIFGGYKYMLARGNDQEVRKARDIIVQALIGLIIVLAAYAITVYLGTIVNTEEVFQEEEIIPT